jgi:hypothetical protein
MWSGYIIRVRYKAMHTGVKRHTLHSIVNLVGAILPITNGKEMNRPI